MLLGLLAGRGAGATGDPVYTFSTMAGLAGISGSADGMGNAARFAEPTGVAIDGAGNVYVADPSSQTIREGTPSSPPAGVLWSTGDNAHGQLGLDWTQAQQTPASIAGEVRAVAARSNDSLFVTTDGTLWAMGDNFWSQLGDGTSINRSRPVAVATGVQSAAVGNSHNLFVKADGTLWGMGYNYYGELGDGTIQRHSTPVLLATGVRSAAAGGCNTFFVKIDGTLWAMGWDDYGQLCDGGWQSRSTPAQVATGVQAVAAADTYTLFLKSDGTVWGAGLIPDGSTTIRYVRSPPIQLAAGVQAMAAGGLHFLLVKTDGTLWAAGDNSFGQLGDGTITNRCLPVLVATGVQAVTAGAWHSALVKTDGTLWAMGRNSSGQLGDGTTSDRSTPVPIATHALDVAAGNFHTVFISAADPGAQPPIITTQPANRAAGSGQDAVFAVGVADASGATYQWQRLAAGGTAWTTLTDDARWTGATTSTLIVRSATAAMNGDAFCCVITNAQGSVTTSPAILSVTAPLVVTTWAGQAGLAGTTDGAGSAARFRAPTDVAIDSTGTLYVADTGNHTIRMITPAGAVTTLAGTAAVSGYRDGTGPAALFAHPSGVAVDRAGNVYVSDTDNSVIRKITPAGAVTTLAGAAHVAGFIDGTGTAARFNGPSGIVTDDASALYVADTLNNVIRKVAPDGTVTTLAGGGYGDGTGRAAGFAGPQGLAMDSAGRLYVADTNGDAIRMVVLPTGIVTTVAGSSHQQGSADGSLISASFANPSGVAVDGAGNLYIADTENQVIRQAISSGMVSTVAGLAGTSGSADGVGTAARFRFPTGITSDASGNLYIADTNNHTIRMAFSPSAPVISAQPQSQTAAPGANVIFATTASGRPAPTYQWYFNGTALSGATGNSLSLANVRSSDAGTYTVAVTNDSKSVTSNPATLTISAAAADLSPADGGGGAVEPWFAGLLALLVAARRSSRTAPVS